MRYSCATLLCDTAVRYCCAAMLCDTAVRHCCATLLYDAAVRHCCATLLCAPVRPLLREALPERSQAESCRNHIMRTCQSHSDTIEVCFGIGATHTSTVLPRVPSDAHLGPSSGHLGLPWDSLDPLGTLLGPTCGPLGALFGSSWPLSGSSLGHLVGPHRHN